MITGSSVAVTGNTPHFVHAFVTSAKEFIPIFQSLISVYKANPTIVIWISWYKKSAGIPTDVTEDTIRDNALQHDLVDVKVCAVSEKWSALKLVVRKERRQPTALPLITPIARPTSIATNCSCPRWL